MRVMMGVLGLLMGPAFSAQADGSKFYKDSRERLNFLYLREVRQVQVHVVARAGRNAAVAEELTRRGAVIRFRADEIDYLRVRLPFKDPATFERLVDLPDIEALAPSNSGEEPSPTLMRSQPPPDSGPKGLWPEPATPVTQPYRPIVDLDGVNFQRRNPFFDGRGVTIGMIDGLPDLLHPNLQRALDLRGNPVPKFPIYEYGGNASDDLSEQKRWVRDFTEVTARGGRIESGGRAYLAPSDGRYLLALMPRPRIEWLGVDMPLVVESERDATVIPILWDEARDTVWVDTHRDDSFVDEKALRPYAVRRDFGIFGVDNPLTPERESVPFTVVVDRESRAVRLALGWDPHGTMVAGVAGEGFNRGQFDALAGQAQIAAYASSSVLDAYNIVEVIYRAMKDPRVDLLLFECDSRQIGAYEIADGASAMAIALDRIAVVTNKPLFIPAHNGAGINSVMDYCLGDNAICIGAYDSGAALRTNIAADVPDGDYVHDASGFGPGGDGSLKPDLVAPSKHLSTSALFLDTFGRRIPGHFQLPREYQFGGGTSHATPTATAAAALLIGAAKQENVKWDGARIRYALYSTARPLVGIPTYQQGRGSIRIDAAWQTLKALDALPDWTPPKIEVSAPVVSAGAAALRTPGRGRGIYEREGWRAGDKRTRQIVLTRRSGSSRPVTYAVEWQGDTASFVSAKTVTLPLNEPVRFSVVIATARTGVHSAIARLRETSSPVDAVSILNTVIAAEAPPAGQFALKRTLDIRRPGVSSLFVHVPAGTTALSFAYTKTAPEKVRVIARGPDQMRFKMDELRQGNGEFAIQDPTPGVWEVFFDNRALMGDIGRTLEPRPTPLLPTHVDLELRWWRIETEVARVAGSQSVELKVRNRGQDIHGRIADARLGSAFEALQLIRAEDVPVFRISVPKGSRLLKAELTELSDPAADITLLLYRLEEGKAELRAIARGPSGPVAVRMADPEEGEWLVSLDPVSVPREGVRARYRDIVTYDALGEFKPQSEQWNTALAVAPQAIPMAPRKLVGVVSVGSQDASAKSLHDVVIPYAIEGR